MNILLFIVTMNSRIPSTILKMATLSTDFFVEINEKTYRDHKYTTYTTTKELCSPLVLFSKVDGTALATCQIIKSTRTSVAEAAIAPSIRSIIAPFHPINDPPFVQRFQCVFGSSTDQPIKDGIEIAFIITNLSSKSKIRFDIMKQQSNPNSRINQINVLHPLQSCTIDCDRENDSRSMILEKFRDSNDDFVTVGEDEEQQVKNSTPSNGMNVALHVYPQEDDQELVSLYKDTVWKVDDCFTIRYAIIHKILPELCERLQKKIAPWIPSIAPLEDPIMQYEMIGGIRFERTIYYPGGRYEDGGYVPSTYKTPVPEYRNYCGGSSCSGSSYGVRLSPQGGKKESSFSLPSMPSIPKISFGKSGRPSSHNDKVKAVNTQVIEQSLITIVKSGDKVVVNSSTISTKFVDTQAQATIGISINNALRFVDGIFNRELLQAKALSQLKAIENKNYQFLDPCCLVPQVDNDKEDKKDEEEEEEENDGCVVCFDSIGMNRCTLLPCAHSQYDFKCIDQILKTREKTCPLCKLTITAIVCSNRE